MREATPGPSADRSYWFREAMSYAPARPLPELQGDADADVVIVGGGYTGLWTAWFLTERDPDARVVVLERSICGAGASGRNAGFLTGWWDELPDLSNRYGSSRALGACRALDESITAIGEWSRYRGADVWYTPAGCMEVASAASQEWRWREAAEACARAGAPDAYRRLTPEDVRAVCDAPVFRGGGFMQRAATVQPARLAFALRAAVLERGVRIHEATHLRRLDAGPPVVARTRSGEVRAEKAVVATNAWAAGWRPLRRVLVVRGSYMTVTAPAPKRLEEIGWTGGECINDLRSALYYFRTTPDGRIAFGGAGRAAGGSRIGRLDYDRTSVGYVVEGFRRFFPSFRDVPLEEAWGGAVDVSGLHHPVFGTLGSGTVHHVSGYSGNGVAPSHLAGRILSALALGADDDPVAKLPMVGASPKRMPPEPFKSAGAALVQSAIMRRESREDEGRRSSWVTRALSRVPARLGFALGRRD